jgi:hypothetical protein
VWQLTKSRRRHGEVTPASQVSRESAIWLRRPRRSRRRVRSGRGEIAIWAPASMALVMVVLEIAVSGWPVTFLTTTVWPWGVGSAIVGFLLASLGTAWTREARWCRDPLTGHTGVQHDSLFAMPVHLWGVGYIVLGMLLCLQAAS